DLWQDQATALAGDAELARQLGRWFSLMQSGMAHGFQSASPAAGTASAAAASGGGEPRLDQLARRLAAIEERLAPLWAPARNPPQSPSPQSSQPQILKRWPRLSPTRRGGVSQPFLKRSKPIVVIPIGAVLHPCPSSGRKEQRACWTFGRAPAGRLSWWSLHSS